MFLSLLQFLLTCIFFYTWKYFCFNVFDFYMQCFDMEEVSIHDGYKHYHILPTSPEQVSAFLCSSASLISIYKLPKNKHKNDISKLVNIFK